MVSDAGGWLWLVIDVGFVVILAVVLAYGIYMWRTRSRNQTVERIRDEATREGYRHPGSDQGGGSQGGAHTVPDPHTRGV